jgi:hypothetical protein
MSANGCVVVGKIQYEVFVLFHNSSNSEHPSSNFDLKNSSGSCQEEGLFGISLQGHVRLLEEGFKITFRIINCFKQAESFCSISL